MLTQTSTEKIHLKGQLLDDRYTLIFISERCAYITRILRRPGKGGRLARVQAAYFGFDNELSAQAYASSLSAKHRATVRPAKRLTGCAYEVKVASDSMTDEQIFRQSAQLSEYDVTPDLEEQPISADEPVSLVLADSDGSGILRYELIRNRKKLGFIYRGLDGFWGHSLQPLSDYRRWQRDLAADRLVQEYDSGRTAQARVLARLATV